MSAGVEFQQAVWRFHPSSKRFELFCEGGGNLFGLTFDADGNLFFSSNGNDLAYHAVQGAYYRKNFGKHGPLHNPYTYGFFEHLPYDQAVAGPRPGGTVYLGDALPERFQAPCSAATSCSIRLHGGGWCELVRRSRRNTAASCLTAGTPGSAHPTCARGPTVPLCSATSTTSAPLTRTPRPNWDRSNGRIYRVAPPGTASVRGLDLGRKTSRELVELLRHPNGWYAEQARAQLAARRDRSTWPALNCTGPPDR